MDSGYFDNLGDGIVLGTPGVSKYTGISILPPSTNELLDPELSGLAPKPSVQEAAPPQSADVTLPPIDFTLPEMNELEILLMCDDPGPDTFAAGFPLPTCEPALTSPKVKAVHARSSTVQSVSVQPVRDPMAGIRLGSKVVNKKRVAMWDCKLSLNNRRPHCWFDTRDEAKAFRAQYQWLRAEQTAVKNCSDVELRRCGFCRRKLATCLFSPADDKLCQACEFVKNHQEASGKKVHSRFLS